MILEEQKWTWDEKLAAISHTEASDLEKFLPHLLGKTFIESYFAGLFNNLNVNSQLLSLIFGHVHFDAKKNLLNVATFLVTLPKFGKVENSIKVNRPFSTALYITL